MILQQCTKDFQSLINQWSVIKTYEDLEESGKRYGTSYLARWSDYIIISFWENLPTIFLKAKNSPQIPTICMN